MKLISQAIVVFSGGPFSALGRAVWDETVKDYDKYTLYVPFSALGRAVWDETQQPGVLVPGELKLSVLSVEPYGMKRARVETRLRQNERLSVLSVEPYGMKHALYNAPRAC